jgi:glucosamine-6-phosphate deaminase
MQLYKLETSDDLGKAASALTAKYINDAIQKNGEARIVLSTGASQFDTLKYLVKEDVNWSRVTGFHLDEYVGLSDLHPASFVKYLKERFVNLLNLKEFNFVSGEGNPNDTITALTVKLRAKPIDVALIGIGENCHIAFNDPPCDIKTKEAYHVVSLDDKCRAQQVGEGWYKSII